MIVLSEEINKALVLYSAAGNVHKAYWLATAAALAHPKTRSTGVRLASFGARASLNVARGTAGAILGTPLVRGGTTTLGGLAGGVAVGAGIGMVVGTGIAYAGWGDQGASRALELYSGQVSVSEYTSTVKKAIGLRL